MFDRTQIRAKLSHTLTTDYVALLGPRGAGVKTFLNSLFTEKVLVHGMKLVSVGLPLGVEDGNDFKELLISRLAEGARTVPPEGALAEAVCRRLDERASATADSRLRIVLDQLGKATTAQYLVIALHALADVPEARLKGLLLMLRDYHNQINNPGEPGARLRFLVAGGARLWRLCRYKPDEPDDSSPFNIAQPFFLDGLSYEELQGGDDAHSLEAAVKLVDLTGGVPSIVTRALEQPDDSNDLSHCFAPLQKNWVSLPPYAKETLKRLAGGEEVPPRCLPHHDCPLIPDVGTPWAEAFWAGFLRLRLRELMWRSPVHRAFVLEQTSVSARPSKAEVIRLDLAERALRLEEALREAEEHTGTSERIAEAHSLAVQTDAPELARVLEAARQGQTTADKHVMTAVVLETKRRLGQFDVFLAHNSQDKPAVIEVAEQLKKEGILPWLDVWEMRPGEMWLDCLDEIIGKVKSAAVFLGPNGTGPWEVIEIQVLLKRFTEARLPVIPVILKGAEGEPRWNKFLDIFHRVDFRVGSPDPLGQLVWGITGSRRG